MYKQIIIAFILVSTGFAQFTVVPSSSYPTLDGILNGKLAYSTGTGAPGGACTMGKDVYTNTSTGDMYWCTATNTWSVKGAAGVNAIDTCADASGSTSAYVCTSAQGQATTNGKAFLFKPQTTNTTTSTITINTVFWPAKKQGSNLIAGDLVGGQWYIVASDGSNWNILSRLGNDGTGGTGCIPAGVSGAVQGATGTGGCLDTGVSAASGVLTAPGGVAVGSGSLANAIALAPGTQTIPGAPGAYVGWIAPASVSGQHLTEMPASGAALNQVPLFAAESSGISVAAWQTVASTLTANAIVKANSSGFIDPSFLGAGRSVKVLAYEVGAEDAAAAFITADLTNHSIMINDGNAKTLTEASCISDAGSQIVTVKVGATTLFTITCVAFGSYSRATTTGSTGYIVAGSMGSTTLVGGAQVDLSGTANATSKDIKIHVFGTEN